MEYLLQRLSNILGGKQKDGFIKELIRDPPQLNLFFINFFN